MASTGETKGSGTKRVRFSETPDIREFTESEPASKRPSRQLDPMEALEGKPMFAALHLSARR